jgi:hypothetical protein
MSETECRANAALSSGGRSADFGHLAVPLDRWSKTGGLADSVERRCAR